ncbi:hypothetical protein H2198_007613 [Neophaeococcomyces mojaviensis]|uniref:Uncharacterized protein n=1 Tax=Neophaeococcomyces mojaviensis TaxID=3383035 RepID=A0ACC2ZZI5_9EURO|nr:hypothetical protein H2198_007613 [Knufia sp. JES_112]
MFAPKPRPLYNVFCGCWFISPGGLRYLPQVELQSHTTILATTSRTVLNQTFHNPLDGVLKEVSYTFPLYDGVSVAGFRCVVGGRSIIGIVKERNQARAEYQEAVSRGQTAGLLEQNPDAADVFTTSIGNVPAGEKIHIEITYLGELKNDAETDEARFTIPTNIAPRYGRGSPNLVEGPRAVEKGGMKITVDVQLEQGVAIRGIQSPSHPIAITMGRTSTTEEDDNDIFESNLGSSTLALGSAELDTDFVIVVLAKGQDNPRALLETHPNLPNQRTLMTTLVPKFNIPNEHPEIVFVVDRSGSMGGKMHLVIDALKIFLKSLPVSVKFNICSFGSSYSFLFDKSRTYDATSLQIAMDHIAPSSFSANYGGTEMLQPVQELLSRRYQDLPLEVMLLTDGEIWNQQALFDEINTASQKNARFFTLGIGSSASSSLVEGIARAGRGFSQWVNDGERIDKRIVRMLKGALTPHIKYKLEVKYIRSEASDEEDFEIIESFEKSMKLVSNDSTESAAAQPKAKKKISLFNTGAKDEPTNPKTGRYDHLPKIAIPNILQTPHNLPELYPHSRSTVYLMLGPDACNQTPTSVILRGTSEHGDLELEIPVQDIGKGETLHKLAAKKAMQELEEGRGWLTEVKTLNSKTRNGTTLKSQHEGNWDLIVEREAVRLGTTFQVGGKFCSFVAVDENAEDLPPYVATSSDSHAQDQTSGPAGQAHTNLQTYQMGLMVLEQQNKNRRMLAKQAPPLPPGTHYSPFQPQTRSVQTGGLFGNSQPAHMQMQQSSIDQDVELKKESRHASKSGSLFGGVFGRKSSSSHNGGAFDKSSSAPGRGMPFTFGATPSATESTASSLFGSPPPPRAPAPSSFGLNSSIVQVQESGHSTGVFGSAQSSSLFGAAGLSASSSPPATYHQASPPTQSFGGSLFRSRGSNPPSPPQPQAAAAHSSSQQSRASNSFAGLPPLERMQRLISLQTFSGSWALTNELLALVSHNAIHPQSFTDAKSMMKYMMDTVEQGNLDADEDVYNEDVCATIIATAWLEVVMQEEEDVWEMVVAKAKGWLEGRIDGSEEIERVIVVVKSLWKK